MSNVAARRLRVAAVLLAIAATVTVPAMLGPVRVNDSYWIDWVWLDQFARELGRGVLYPRWLPDSHAGLGSPVFYYYPPLAFFLGAAFVLAGLPIYPALLATFLAGSLLSGVGMYAWLRGQARAPLLGAAAFMIAPYHACNFYLRGAVAEFVATAFLPLVMLGLRRLEQRKPYALAATAVAYAALICSHLPLALLASLFLIAPYLAICWRRDRRNLNPMLLALGAGIALAAIYLVPALMLEHYRDSAKLWEDPVLQPQNWSFWNAAMPQAYPAMLAIGAALAVPLAALIVVERSRWAVLGLACVLLGIGLIPLLWALPLLRSVQFPFRIFPIAEFALATALASATRKPLVLGIASLAPLFVTAVIVTGAPPSGGVPMAQLRALHPDVPENLPPGNRPYSWPSQWAQTVAQRHRAPQFTDGVTIDPVFYYPAWKVRCGGRPVNAFPDAQTQLLAYRGQGCERTLGRTPAEYAGTIVSVLALLALAGASLVRRRRPAG